VKGPKGYSLLEVLVAMAILMIGIIGTFRIFPMAMRQTRQADEIIQAGELAASRLDQLRMVGATEIKKYDYNDPASVFWNYSFTDGNPEVNSPEVDFICESYATSIQRTEGPSNINLQRAVFSVRMKDGRDETFVTYIVEQ